MHFFCLREQEHRKVFNISTISQSLCFMPFHTSSSHDYLDSQFTTLMRDTKKDSLSLC